MATNTNIDQYLPAFMAVFRDYVSLLLDRTGTNERRFNAIPENTTGIDTTRVYDSIDAAVRAYAGAVDVSRLRAA